MVVLLFKLSSAFLGKLMGLQGDCRPDGKREIIFPFLAPALGQEQDLLHSRGYGQATSTPLHMHTHPLCRSAASPRSGLLHDEEWRQQMTAGAQQRLSVKPVSE